MQKLLYIWILFFAMYSTVIHADITTNLVAHYEFENNVLDTANQLNATASTTPRYASGKMGQAIEFNNDYALATPLDELTYFNGSWTKAVWVKLNSSQTGSGNLLSSGNYAMWMPAQKLESYPFGITGTTTLNDNQWHHLAITYDDTTHLMQVIVDNIVEKNGTITKPSLSLSNFLGINQHGTGGVNGIVGLMDDARVYNRALSASDILQLYAYNPPVIQSTPTLIGMQNASYATNFTAISQASATTTWSASTLPSWLTLTNISTTDVSTLAGSGATGTTDGTGTAAMFNNPQAMATDSIGNIYVADASGNKVRKITPSGVVTTFYGDGTPTLLNNPNALAFDSAGNLYISEAGNNRITKITSTGVASVFASGLSYPGQIAIDSSSNLYVTGNDGYIKKITPAAVVSTFSVYIPSVAGLAIDKFGKMYATDYDKGHIFKIALDGNATVLAGDGTSGGFADGTGVAAKFNRLTQITTDTLGNIYAADQFGHRIRKITPAGVVTTVAGNGTGAFLDGASTSAQFQHPAGITFGKDGALYIGDGSNNRVRKITLPHSTLSGMPTSVGTFDVNLSVTDGTNTVLQNITIIIGYAPLVQNTFSDVSGGAYPYLGQSFIADSNKSVSSVDMVFGSAANNVATTLRFYNGQVNCYDGISAPTVGAINTTTGLIVTTFNPPDYGNNGVITDATVYYSNMKLSSPLTLIAGNTYTVCADSAGLQFAYNNFNPYPSGQEYQSTNGYTASQDLAFRINTDFIEGNGTLTGTVGNDLFYPQGNATIDGANGTDTVFFSATKSQYTLTKSDSTYTLTNGTYIYTLANIEYLSFVDVQNVAIGTLVPKNITISTSPSTCPSTVSGVITASADCTMSVSDIATALSSGDLTISTGGTGAINITSTLSFASANKLTLVADGNISINADITASNANGKVALYYGQGVAANGNTATYSLNNSKINLQAGLNFISKLGSDGAITTWTVITALGSAGSTTGTDLQGMNGALSGKFVLGGDIDASGTAAWNSGAGFMPVGINPNEFTGSFDGLGHTIDSLYINQPSINQVGLFSTAHGTNSYIRNINLTNASVAGDLTNSSSGAVVGNSFVSIYNVSSAGTVSGGNAGGLVGNNWGIITNSHSSANITSNNSGGGAAGGLTGYTGPSGILTNVYATGNVTGSAYMTGGLVGQITDNNQGFNAWIINAYATGNVTSSGSFVGGLVGYSAGVNGKISGAYATGNVTATNTTAGQWAGGLIGRQQTTVENVYATGNVSIAYTSSNAGGLVGRNMSGWSITNAYSSGSVIGPGAIGGLAAVNEGGATITAGFWNTQTSGEATSSGGTGLTTAQMQTLSTFTTAGWNVAATSTPSSNPYPNLSMGGATIWVLPPVDTTPNTFTLTPTINATVGADYTASLTVSGINTATLISITGGKYSINWGTDTNETGLVHNGDTVTIKVTSSSAYGTTSTATLTIGGVSANFSVTTTSIADTIPPTITKIYDRFRLTNASPFTIALNINDSGRGDLTLNIINSSNSVLNYTSSHSGTINYNTYNTTPITLTITPTSNAQGLVQFEVKVTDSSGNTVSKHFSVVIENQTFHEISSKENNETYNAISSGNITNNLYSFNSWNDYNSTAISHVVEYEKHTIVSNVATTDNNIRDIDGVVTHITKTSDIPQTLKFVTALNNSATTSLFSENHMPFVFTDISSTSQKVYVQELNETLSVDQNYSFNDKTYSSMDTFMSEVVDNNSSYGLIRSFDKSKILTLGSGSTSGNLIEVDENSIILNSTTVGSWERKTVKGYDTLLLHPVSNIYQQDAAFVYDAGTGKVRFADYKASGDIYSYVLLNKAAKDELYKFLSPNPKIATALNNGYTYISLPSSKTLCDADVQRAMDSCDKNNTLESVFGINGHVNLVFKFGREWMYWNNDVNASPSYSIQKFSTIDPLEGIIVKTSTDTSIYLPFDEDSEIVNDYSNLFSAGWLLASNNKAQTVEEISASLTTQHKDLVYILLLRDNVWHVYVLPTNDSAVEESIPRLSSVNRYESYWVYFRASGR